MGADLYIEKLEKIVMKEFPYKKDFSSDDYEQREALREKYCSYYRDSYNATNLMWLVGFSYWSPPDEFKFLKGNGNLSRKGVKAFIEFINNKEEEFNDMLNPKILKLYLESKHAKVDDDENTPIEWSKFFTAKRERLLKFLQTADEHKSTIQWSV